MSNFLPDSIKTLLEGLVAAGCSFSLFGDAESFPGGKHYIKHDIHGDVSISLRIAKLEKDMGIKATYFCLHQHPLMQSIYDKPETWEMLRDIQLLGHEVALHVDPFILIQQYGNVNVGVTRELVKFYSEHIAIRGANCHGNTSFSKSLNFNPRMFFSEFVPPAEQGVLFGAGMTLWEQDKTHLCTDAGWNQHYGKACVKDMGFEYWSDASVWFPKAGQKTCDIYFSDNYGDFGANKTQEDVDTIVAKVKSGSCLYLLHPQFYLVQA